MHCPTWLTIELEVNFYWYSSTAEIALNLT